MVARTLCRQRGLLPRTWMLKPAPLHSVPPSTRVNPASPAIGINFNRNRLNISTPLLTTSFALRQYSTPSISQTTTTNPNTQKKPPKMKLLYPTTLRLDVSRLAGFPTLTLHAYDAKAPTIDPSLLDATILITWANSPANLAFAAKNMPQLRWIQSLAAGPNDVLSAGFNTTAQICVTTGSGLHDRTVAEHALGLLLSAARRFYEMRDFQLQGKWPGHLGGPQPDREPGSFRTLRDARVLIWGYGNIARCLAPHLTGLGATVRGVARSPGVRGGVEVFGEDKLPELLAETDALVMILPGDASTKHALGKERLKMLPKHAWVVNVGRGTSVDEEALCDALEEGRIGGAALDVFETEPLPEGSRLWKAPNVIVSPHAAGGRPQDAEDLIVDNLRRFLAGQELRNFIAGVRSQL